MLNHLLQLHSADGSRFCRMRLVLSPLCSSIGQTLHAAVLLLMSLAAGSLCSIIYVPACCLMAATGAVEMVTVYYETSKVHPRLMNSAIRHSLWRFTKRHDAAFRACAAARIGQPTASMLAANRSMPPSAHGHQMPSDASAPSTTSRQQPDWSDSRCVVRSQLQLPGCGLAATQLLSAEVQVAQCQCSSRGESAESFRIWRSTAACIALAVCARRFL